MPTYPALIDGTQIVDRLEIAVDARAEALTITYRDTRARTALVVMAVITGVCIVLGFRGLFGDPKMLLLLVTLLWFCWMLFRSMQKQTLELRREGFKSSRSAVIYLDTIDRFEVAKSGSSYQVAVVRHGDVQLPPLMPLRSEEAATRIVDKLGTRLKDLRGVVDYRTDAG